MEPYHYWAIAGFIFLFCTLFNKALIFLLLAGGMFFSSVIAFKYPDCFFAQIIAGILCALLSFISIKNKGEKNEHE